jgi:hypothetical protein
MKLRIFRISFKLYYHELCDWSSDYVRARNRHTALRKFAKLHGIKDANVNDPESWRWWEDYWYKAFHLIEEVSGSSRPCSRCNGTGVILPQQTADSTFQKL